MKKVIKITESVLENIIHRVLNEQSSQSPLCPVQCKTKVLGKGNAGEDVKLIQNALAKCGFNKEKFGGGMKVGCDKDHTKCDGKFNTETAKAVREFQKLLGLTMDGLVGPKTLSNLMDGQNIKDIFLSGEVNKNQEPCLAPIKCNCKKKTDKISDQEQSVTGGGGNSVKVGCNKSITCFKKFNKPSGVDACGLAKCLGICLPKGMCEGTKINVDCGECPKYINEMPGVGVDYKKKRSQFIQGCIDNGCTKVAV